MVSLENCIKDGLLKQIPPSMTEAKNQLGKASVLLSESKSCYKNDDLNAAVMTAYAAIFDAGRSLLFKDGYRERSHVCVVRYLEARYKNQFGSDTIILLDEYREKRHKVVYSSDYYSSEEEAKNMIEFAEKFIAKVEEIMETK